jgi:dTMP kinase
MSDPSKAFFVVVEGLDGTGKSTIVRQVARILNEPVCLPGCVKLTFEPHDPSACGIYIRQVLMHRIKAPRKTLALAFAMNRVDHCSRDIAPFLAQANSKERVVLCDRYYMSSLVYQSDETLSMQKILELNDGALRPDLTLFLHASSKTCYQRMRSRDQSRELFETNLASTRKKYEEAIALLRGRAENIVEVPAEEELSKVVIRVLNALVANSPDWLATRIHPHLILEDTTDVFEFSKTSIDSCVAQLVSSIGVEPPASSDDLRKFNQQLTRAAQGLVSMLSFSDLAALFLSILAKEGFQIHERLPWTDIDAVEISCRMPLGIVQRGAAIFMGDSQRYDAILPNLLGEKSIALGKLSDFLVILDPNPSVLHSNYYERDQAQTGTSSDVSPSIVVLGREHIASRLAQVALRIYLKEASSAGRTSDASRKACEDLLNTEAVPLPPYRIPSERTS